jgi:hypothetical protein
MAKTHRTARPFIPSIETASLERRDAPSAIVSLFPPQQSYISLNDNRGQSYPVHNGDDLRNQLMLIEAQGRVIGKLLIKGHGNHDGISLSDKDPADFLVVVSGHVNFAGANRDELLRHVTGPNTIITLAGCESGKLAQNLSKITNGTVCGSGWPLVIGVPGTPIGIGNFIHFRGGKAISS